jgi:hypothetical protein
MVRWHNGTGKHPNGRFPSHCLPTKSLAKLAQHDDEIIAIQTIVTVTAKRIAAMSCNAIKAMLTQQLNLHNLT